MLFAAFEPQFVGDDRPITVREAMCILERFICLSIKQVFQAKLFQLRQN